MCKTSVATWRALGGTVEAPPRYPEDYEHLEWKLAHPNALPSVVQSAAQCSSVPQSNGRGKQVNLYLCHQMVEALCSYSS